MFWLITAVVMYVTAAGYMQMTLLWFSTNITANNMALGMMGPLIFGLGFVDSALCVTFGALLGALGVGYMGTFGPASGNRTMVCSHTLIFLSYIFFCFFVYVFVSFFFFLFEPEQILI